MYSSSAGSSHDRNARFFQIWNGERGTSCAGKRALKKLAARARSNWVLSRWILFLLFVKNLMPTITSLTKVAALAAATALVSFGSVSAEGNFLQQQVDGLSTSWRHGKDILQQQELPNWFPKFPSYARNGDFIKTFSHPAFPGYSVRYKKPALCDPDVKQVKSDPPNRSR